MDSLRPFAVAALACALSGTALAQRPPQVYFDRLVNGAKGLCLDVQGTAGQSGANVLLWDCDGGVDQTWSMNDAGEIRNGTQQLCLEAAERDGARGRNVALWTCTGENDQRWAAASTDTGFVLRNEAKGMCLDVSGRDGKRGDNVLLWDCDGGVDQNWSYAPANVTAPAPQPVPVVQPTPVPAPPPAPANVAMSDDAFAKILRGMENASFPDEKVRAFKAGARNRWLTCGQLVKAVEALSFPRHQVEIVREVAKRVTDPENVEDVVAAFSFPNDRNTVRDLIAQ